MGRLTRFIFLCILSVSAVAQSESQQPPRISPSQIDTGAHRWIAGALNAIQTIKRLDECVHDRRRTFDDLSAYVRLSPVSVHQGRCEVCGFKP
jgi:hypothetical protein